MFLAFGVASRVWSVLPGIKVDALPIVLFTREETGNAASAAIENAPAVAADTTTPSTEGFQVGSFPCSSSTAFCVPPEAMYAETPPTAFTNAVPIDSVVPVAAADPATAVIAEPAMAGAMTHIAPATAPPAAAPAAPDQVMSRPCAFDTRAYEATDTAAPITAPTAIGRRKAKCPVGSLYLTGLLFTYAYLSHACVPCVPVGTMVSGEMNLPNEGSIQRALKK
jgi:hypothetical protein